MFHVKQRALAVGRFKRGRGRAPRLSSRRPRKSCAGVGRVLGAAGVKQAAFLLFGGFLLSASARAGRAEGPAASEGGRRQPSRGVAACPSARIGARGTRIPRRSRVLRRTCVGCGGIPGTRATTPRSRQGARCSPASSRFWPRSSAQAFPAPALSAFRAAAGARAAPRAHQRARPDDHGRVIPGRPRVRRLPLCDLGCSAALQADAALAVACACLAAAPPLPTGRAPTHPAESLPICRLRGLLVRGAWRSAEGPPRRPRVAGVRNREPKWPKMTT